MPEEITAEEKGTRDNERYTTKEARAEVFAKYRLHREGGLSVNSFPECSVRVIQDMVKRYPQEFDSELLAQIERTYLMYWEELGKRGANGSEEFNAPAWIFTMKNRAKWSDRQLISSDSENPFEMTIRLVE